MNRAQRKDQQQYADVQELESRLKNVPNSAQFDVESPELLSARTDGCCSAMMVQPKGQSGVAVAKQ